MIRDNYYERVTVTQGKDNIDIESRLSCSQCLSSFGFKQSLNWHWKGVHHYSVDTQYTILQYGKMSWSTITRFPCLIDCCNCKPFTTIQQISAHYTPMIRIKVSYICNVLLVKKLYFLFDIGVCTLVKLLP